MPENPNLKDHSIEDALAILENHGCRMVSYWTKHDVLEQLRHYNECQEIDRVLTEEQVQDILDTTVERFEHNTASNEFINEFIYAEIAYIFEEEEVEEGGEE